MTEPGWPFPGALPSTECSFPGGLGRAVLLAWCQVTLQLGSTSPPGALLGGHLSKESPVWVGSEAGAEEGAPDPTVFLLPRLLHLLVLPPGSTACLLPPCVPPHTPTLILLPSLPKKKKKIPGYLEQLWA